MTTDQYERTLDYIDRELSMLDFECCEKCNYLIDMLCDIKINLVHLNDIEEGKSDDPWSGDGR